MPAKLLPCLNSEGVIVALWNRRADIKVENFNSTQQTKPEIPPCEKCGNDNLVYLTSPYCDTCRREATSA